MIKDIDNHDKESARKRAERSETPKGPKELQPADTIEGKHDRRGSMSKSANQIYERNENDVGRSHAAQRRVLSGNVARKT